MRPEAEVCSRCVSKPSRLGMEAWQPDGSMVMAQHWLGCNAHGQTVCGGTLVQDLGRVEWQRKTFHSESNIWPVGYRSVRFYASRRRAPRRRAGAVAHGLQSQPVTYTSLP